MQWLEQLLPGSFRNVPFQADSMTFVVGHETVVRDYPFQDLPTVQAMGEATDEIRFSAYVIGSDYLDKRDALANVLNGSGVLVHPTRGRMRVSVKGPVKVRENPTAEGGIARFDLVFVRAQARRYPVAQSNLQQQASEQIEAAKLAVRKDFANNFSTAGQPGWSRQSALSDVSALLDKVERGFAALTADVSGFKRRIRRARSALLALLDTPLQLAELVQDLVTLPVQVQAVAGEALAQLEALWGPREVVFDGALNAPLTPVLTPSRQRQQRNQVAFDLLRRHSMTLEAARVANNRVFVSTQEALTLRTVLSHQFQTLLTVTDQTVGFDEVGGIVANSAYLALAATHTRVLRDLAQRSHGLGRITEYVPESVQPLVYISYRLYGTARYADELYNNNPHITHPMLVPAGKPLKVIAHD